MNLRTIGQIPIRFLAVILGGLTISSSPVAAQTSPAADARASTTDAHAEEVFGSSVSPDGKYRVSLVNQPWMATKPSDYGNYHVVRISEGDRVLAEVPHEGFLDNGLKAQWAYDGKFVAFNYGYNREEDTAWIADLTSGKFVKKASDAIGKGWMKTGVQALGRKYPEANQPHHGGHEFFRVNADTWENGLLHVKITRQELFDDLDANFVYVASIDPANPTHIVKSAMVIEGQGTLTADNSTDMTLQGKLLGWWATTNHAYEFRDDGMVYPQGAASATAPPKHWKVRNGLYYENSAAGVIVTLTDDEFTCRTQGQNPQTVTMKRISKAEAEKY